MQFPPRNLDLVHHFEKGDYGNENGDIDANPMCQTFEKRQTVRHVLDQIAMLTVDGPRVRDPVLLISSTIVATSTSSTTQDSA